MAEEIDKDPETSPEGEEEEGFVEIDGEKFKEDPDNKGEALKGEDNNPIPFEERSKESEEEPITAERAYELARAAQKGYTLTRQDMAEIRANQQKIQEALEEIRKNKTDEFGGDLGEDEPLTVKKFLDLQTQQRQAQETANKAINQKIERQLGDLKAQGIITTQKEEEELLNFAVKHKISDLSKAAERWQELQAAKKEGIKEGLKGRVKQKAGSKIGTSQKTKTDREQGFDYGEIAGSDMEELAEE